MQNRKKITDLDVYIEALDFANLIWKICSTWDYFTQKTVGAQLVAAADSISANIAEGYGRYHYKENLRFCYYSRGYLEEVQDWLRKSYTRNLILEKDKKEIEIFINNYPAKLNGYINYIKNCISRK